MTAALVLAAGSASRFGGQKLVAPYRGAPLVRRVVENALDSGADRVLVVVGHEADAVEETLAGLAVETVRNPEYREGMASSIRAGIRALAEGCEEVLVVLGDQPEVDAGLMDRVLEADPGGGVAVVAPVYREGQGNPVLFRASVFPELLVLRGDRGARSVVERDPARVRRVTVERPMPRDVDTAADLRRLAEEAGPG
ncbi:MAG: NTP transferase domain-containing protein [Gemmatimonadetes bacterium]|nr:nucleotidyltransferase family protein [Gemmatimonadota bacterium]NIR80784.1 nucleotidyltransferase family protein [Gemmatimonadota bacterium]NIT89602.1 nucleotidyltransferase family protein [Gemmatimonadota bacterium]NIU33384.1 nucleotidyltransferase family protein [Gemmatimonadota bacterium]NIU37676.1 NTP transferase domain-containing protein [Gemmatimonadota bacterium]